MDELTLQNIRPTEKAALVLVALGVETAPEVLRNLSEQEVEDISIEIAKLRNVGADVLSSVIEEFYQMMMANSYIVQGGIQFAKDVLEKAWGRKKADDLLKRV